MEFEFVGEVIEWRGPSPFYFVTVEPTVEEQIREASSQLTYGWGVIPAHLVANGVTWSTSLFPRDGGYLVPVKDAVRTQTGLTLGDFVTMRMTLGGSRGNDFVGEQAEVRYRADSR